MARCELTELDTQFCDHCRPKPAVRKPPPIDLDAPYWFPAGFPGRCICGQPFPAGTRISREGSGWIAECCEDT